MEIRASLTAESAPNAGRFRAWQGTAGSRRGGCGGEKPGKRGGGKHAHRAAFVLFSPFVSLKVKWERNKAKNKALLLILAH